MNIKRLLKEQIKLRQTHNNIKFEICNFLKLITPIAMTVIFMIAKKQLSYSYKVLTMQNHLLQILSLYFISLYNLSIQIKRCHIDIFLVKK